MGNHDLHDLHDPTGSQTSPIAAPQNGRNALGFDEMTLPAWPTTRIGLTIYRVAER